MSPIEGIPSETRGGLILSTLSYVTVNSQDDSHSELAVSFPLICNSNGELAVSYL